MPILKPPIKVSGPPKLGSQPALQDLPQAADDLWRRLFIRGVPDGLEQLHGYRPGGYHPIHLQDELHDGRYRVIHKLGHGGYSTVWLCRDQSAESPSYVAIKILVASHSQRDSPELLFTARLKADGISRTPYGEHLCLPLAQFESYSPNGMHMCLVYPVLGQLSRDGMEHLAREYGATRVVREVARQAVGALAVLHDRDICHGDFRPSNILLRLHGLDGLEEPDLLSMTGQPEMTDINIRKDNHPTPDIPFAPRYLVYPLDFDGVGLELHAQVIDFGQSFEATQGQSRSSFGIPANYAAPEVILETVGSKSMDLWSLGCTLYEMRTGQPLFDVFQLSRLHKKYYVNEISSLLGPLTRSLLVYDDPGDGFPTRRLIHGRLADCHDCAGATCAHPKFQVISESEATAFADLLERLLRYRPEQRVSAQKVLGHNWFHTDYD